jgi:hypothetical protein
MEALRALKRAPNIDTAEQPLPGLVIYEARPQPPLAQILLRPVPDGCGSAHHRQAETALDTGEPDQDWFPRGSHVVLRARPRNV